MVALVAGSFCFSPAPAPLGDVNLEESAENNLLPRGDEGLDVTSFLGELTCFPLGETVVEFSGTVARLIGSDTRGGDVLGTGEEANLELVLLGVAGTWVGTGDGLIRVSRGINCARDLGTCFDFVNVVVVVAVAEVEFH